MRNIFNKEKSIKIVSNEQKFWLDNKERCLKAIEEHKNILKLEEAMLETIERKLKCMHT